MDLNKLKYFLLNFDLDYKKIISDKNFFFDFNNNVYLSKNENFEIQDLIFITLKKQLVSKYLLKIIKDNTDNIVEILSEKQALNFTYSKDLVLENIIDFKDKKFSKGKYYVVLYEEKILGYCEFVKVSNKFIFKNLMNIGEYLKE